MDSTEFGHWIHEYVGLVRQCDNGTEFKGAVLELCARHGIEVRNSSSYHPQTNGSVEAANKIFKRQLRSLQIEFGTGVDDWVRFLPDLAIAINCAKPKRFPASFTPYNVFFGRSPHWLTPPWKRTGKLWAALTPMLPLPALITHSALLLLLRLTLEQAPIHLYLPHPHKLRVQCPPSV